ncbi:MAG: hypothetical protein H6825_05570 [Planctomycetes bacterium]|nr:hypothetical protein [Planctomycetota bacterium]
MITGDQLAAAWWTLSLGVAVWGALRFARATRARRPGASTRWRATSGAALLAMGLLSTPPAQAALARPAHERMLARVMSFRGRPVAEMYAELGRPTPCRGGCGHYDASPWFAPFDWHDVRLVSTTDALWFAYIDD